MAHNDYLNRKKITITIRFALNYFFYYRAAEKYTELYNETEAEKNRIKSELEDEIDYLMSERNKKAVSNLLISTLNNGSHWKVASRTYTRRQDVSILRYSIGQIKVPIMW